MKDKKFIPGKSYVPVSGATITDADKKILHSLVDSEWYTEWHYCKLFRDDLKKVVKKKYVRLTNSGSSASLIAMSAALQKFDADLERPYVLTCATGFPTTVSPIYQNGRIPLYVDFDCELLDIRYYSSLERAIVEYGDKICGAIFTHTLGFPFDEQRVRQILGEDKFLIADCCDALGSEIENEGLVPVGTYADISTYSFFPAHHITTAEGGAVATNDSELDELMRCLSNWGRSCYCEPGQTNTCGKRFEQEDHGNLPEGWDHKYIFTMLGYNLKMTEFQAALGYSQLERLEENKIFRRANYKFLYDVLSSIPRAKEYLYFYDLPNGTNPFGFPIYVMDDSINKLISFLEEHKVRTRRLFGGNLIRQPAFKDMPRKTMSLTGSDDAMNSIFWIGCHEAIDLEMMKYVYETFREFYK